MERQEIIVIIRDGFFTKNKPYWIEPISDNIFYNKKLIKIITFYLFHCPCKNVFNIGKNFSEYGWDNLNVLNRILRKETDASCVSVFASTYKELKEKLKCPSEILSILCRNQNDI